MALIELNLLTLNKVTMTRGKTFGVNEETNKSRSELAAAPLSELTPFIYFD
jgi:hypothetical protein